MDDRKGSCLQKKILKKKIMFVGPELVHCLLVQNFMKYLKLFGVLESSGLGFLPHPPNAVSLAM